MTDRRICVGQIKTCLVSKNSGRAGQEYHAPERSAVPIYCGYHSRGQGNGHQTHPKNNEHVEAIEKGREYLVEAWFSQGDSKR